jgi:hypothetical protein
VTTTRKPTQDQAGDPAVTSDSAPTEAAAAPVDTADSTTVTLAYPWTDADGTDHKPGTVLTVSRDTARDLIRDGRARAGDTPTPKE